MDRTNGLANARSQHRDSFTEKVLLSWRSSWLVESVTNIHKTLGSNPISSIEGVEEQEERGEKKREKEEMGWEKKKEKGENRRGKINCNSKV